jgi:hypothetical protein
MYQLKTIPTTPLGVYNHTQQHLIKQKGAPIGGIYTINLINFIQLIHNGQEKQYSFESELCKGFTN